jgi:shikimate kinase
MGTGKSLVGKVLEQRTGFRRFDTDEIISSKLRIAIEKIFSTHGEEHFRELETETLRSLSTEEPTIIVTGGGIVLRSENVDLLKGLGAVVWLDADEATLRTRIDRLSDHPEQIAELILKNIRDFPVGE